MIYAGEKFGYERAQEEYRTKFNSKSRLPMKNPPEFEEVVRGHIGFFRSVKSDTDQIYINIAKRFNRLVSKPIAVHDIDPDPTKERLGN